MTPAPGTAESVFVRGLRTWREEGPRVFLLKVLFVLGYRRAYVLRRSLPEPIEEMPTVSQLIDESSGDSSAGPRPGNSARDRLSAQRQAMLWWEGGPWKYPTNVIRRGHPAEWTA
jgi:hypothetical protein